MVKVFREEPLFVKVRKPAQEFPTWIHLKVPQGRYKVNAPLQHRLICKEAQLIPECEWSELYTINSEYAKIVTLDYIDPTNSSNKIAFDVSSPDAPASISVTYDSATIPLATDAVGYSTGLHTLVSANNGRDAEINVTAVDRFTRITEFMFVKGGSHFIVNEDLTVPPSVSTGFEMWEYSTGFARGDITTTPRFVYTKPVTDPTTGVITNTTTSHTVDGTDGSKSVNVIDGGATATFTYDLTSGVVSNVRIIDNLGNFKKYPGETVTLLTENPLTYLTGSNTFVPVFGIANQTATQHASSTDGVLGGTQYNGMNAFANTLTQADLTSLKDSVNNISSTKYTPDYASGGTHGAQLNLIINRETNEISAQTPESGFGSFGYANNEELVLKTGYRTNYIRRNISDDGRNYHSGMTGGDADPLVGASNSYSIYTFPNGGITYPNNINSNYWFSAVWQPSSPTDSVQYVLRALRKNSADELVSAFNTNTYNPSHNTGSGTQQVYELPRVKFSQNGTVVSSISIDRQGNNFGESSPEKNLQVGDVLEIPSIRYRFHAQISASKPASSLTAFPSWPISNATVINTQTFLNQMDEETDEFLGTQLTGPLVTANTGSVRIETDNTNYVEKIYLPLPDSVTAHLYDGYIVQVKATATTNTKTTKIYYRANVYLHPDGWQMEDKIDVLSPGDVITYINVKDRWYSSRGGVPFHYTIVAADFTDQKVRITLGTTASDLEARNTFEERVFTVTEDDLIMPNPWSLKVKAINTNQQPHANTNKSMGAPHNHLFLEATTASSVSSSHDMMHGAMESEELLKNSTKFAKLTFGHGGKRYIYPTNLSENPELKHIFYVDDSPLWECNRDDEAYAFPLGCSDETSLHLRVSDCEGHGLDMLSKPSQEGQGTLFHPEVMIELTISLLYQVFVQDVEMPQHPKEGLLGYYRNAITEPLSNI